jgi:hypothetical protein
MKVEENGLFVGRLLYAFNLETNYYLYSNQNFRLLEKYDSLSFKLILFCQVVRCESHIGDDGLFPNDNPKFECSRVGSPRV